jgi:hypothetical protein
MSASEDRTASGVAEHWARLEESSRAFAGPPGSDSSTRSTRTAPDYLRQIYQAAKNVDRLQRLISDLLDV